MTRNVAKLQQKQAEHRRTLYGQILLGVCLLLASGCMLPQNRTARNTVKHSPSHAVDSPFVNELPAKSTQPIQPVGFVQEIDDGAVADTPEYHDSSEPTAVVVEALPIPSPEQTTDLDSLIAQALATHPKLAAARQRVAALSHRVPQVTALDDPMFGNTFWPIQDQALQTAGGRVAHQFSLNQKVPWPKKLDTRGSIGAARSTGRYG